MEKKTMRVCVLHYECEMDAVIAGVYTEENAEKEMKEYFLDYFNNKYADEDDQKPEPDAQTFANRMVGRLLVKQDSEDLNDSDVFFKLTYKTLNF